MKKLTILVDFDDVLFPLIPEWVKTLNNTYNTSVSPNQIRNWNISSFFPLLTEEQVFAPLYEDEFWEKLTPAKDGVYYLTKMIQEGHNIKIVTATYYQNVKVKMELLFYYYPYITWNDVVITSDKQSIKGDVLIDDAPHNLEGGDYYKILVNAPHNYDYDAEINDMKRVSGLADAYKIIKKLSNVGET